MAACEPLVLGSHVLDKYRACKLEFNFDKGSDEVFLDFLLDTSVKVIDIMKHLNPVLNIVTSSADSPAAINHINRSPGSKELQQSTAHHKTPKHLAECMNCRPTVHRPLFQPPTSCSHFTPRRSPAKKFVQKLPNFVKPTVSRDHKLSEKNFVEFKCSPQVPVSDKRNTSSDQAPNSGNFVLNPPQNSDTNLTNSNPIDLELPASSSAPTETIDNINAEISQFEKEIGSVLESLTQSRTEQEISVKRVSEGNTSLSMIGMKQCETQDCKPSDNGQKLYSGKHSYTRLNSRYKKYPDEMLKQAMQSVQLGYKTVAQAAKEYHIPRQTLQYRLFKRKKKFHVFAPNIPYTNNFFIENYNNTQTESSETGRCSKVRSPERVDSDDVRLVSDDVTVGCDDVSMDSQNDVNCSETFVNESDLRLSLEQTVKELLQCSEKILTESAPVLDSEVRDSETVLLKPSQSESDNCHIPESTSELHPSYSDVVIEDVISDIKTEISESNLETETDVPEGDTVIDLD